MTLTGVASWRSGTDGISAEAYRAQRVDTLADLAYRQIEALFVDGTLVPGSIISEPQLHRLTGLGRAPVREAVKRLEAERLLLPMHRKGIHVPPIEISEHLYLLEIRRPIETYICRTAAMRANEDERAALRACAGRYRRESGNLEHAVRANRDYEYKQIVVAATRNPHVVPVIGRLHTLSRRFWHFHSRFDGDLGREAESDRMHVAIIDAIVAGDPEKAAAAASAFIDFLVRTTQAVLTGSIGKIGFTSE